MATSAFESKDTLVLRLKYHKTTVFVPCRPISTLLHVKQALLSAAQQTKQQDPAAHSSSDGKSYPGWADMDAADDIGLFLAGSAGGESSTVDGMTTFMPIDQDAAGDKTTVSKAGLRDADVVCVGFRAQGAASISQPLVQFTDNEEEDDDEQLSELTEPPVSL